MAKKLKRRKVLKYHGLDQKTKMWMPHGTYGGELTENLVQHIARDLMADAMLRVEEHPVYQNCLSVHDEEIAESGEDEGDNDEFHELISRTPTWAAGCPIDAEVAKSIVKRYKKG
jgi:DNA polymerase